MTVCLDIIRSDASNSNGNSIEVNIEDPIVHVSLMLDRYPNAAHSFIYTAIAEGYMKENGIELSIRQPGKDLNPIELVASGNIDLALGSQPEVIVARSENLPVISIAAIVRHPLNYLMVPKASTVQTPKNLVGRKVGFTGSVIDKAIMRTMVDADSGNSSEVTMTNMNHHLVQAMSLNQVDAIYGGNINEEYLQPILYNQRKWNRSWFINMPQNHSRSRWNFVRSKCYR